MGVSLIFKILCLYEPRYEQNCPWFPQFRQTKTIQISTYLLADQLIRQTFFRQMLEKSQFVKFPPAKPAFPLYDT